MAFEDVAGVIVRGAAARRILGKLIGLRVKNGDLRDARWHVDVDVLTVRVEPRPGFDVCMYSRLYLYLYGRSVRDLYPLGLTHNLSRGRAGALMMYDTCSRIPTSTVGKNQDVHVMSGYGYLWLCGWPWSSFPLD